MREFLKNQLKTLKAKRGLRQVDNYSDEEISALLDEIEKVSKASIIPIDRQQAIIQTQVIADPEFIGMNAHVVSKWFRREIDSNRAKYMALMQDRVDPEIEKREKENKEFYKSQLDSKRKSNPKYDPIAEGQKVLKKLVSNDKDVKKIRRWDKTRKEAQEFDKAYKNQVKYLKAKNKAKDLNNG